MSKAKSKMFPRTLYKRDKAGKLSFTNKKHRDIRYDSVVVEDEEEKGAAIEMGYVDKYSSILSESSVVSEEIEDEPDEEGEPGNDEEEF